MTESILQSKILFSSRPTNQLLNLENVIEAKGLHTKENNNKFIMTIYVTFRYHSVVCLTVNI
jgi:hypothetical protein